MARRLHSERGSNEIRTMLGVGMLLVVFWLYPGPFVNFVHWGVDAVLTSLGHAFGNPVDSPVPKPAKPYEPTDIPGKER